MARIEATKMGAETLKKLASDLKNSNNNFTTRRISRAFG